MKKVLKSILCILAVFAMVACNSDDEVEQPTASVSINKTTLNINESMEIHFTGSASDVVVYTGDANHRYDMREESNYGLVVNKGLFTYAYSTPGTYTVVVVATNHGNEGKDIKRDTYTFDVKVIDDVTTIDKISAPAVLYDEVFATAVNETDWVLALPRKIKYKTSTPSVSLSQKLKFYIESDMSEISIDGKAYATNTKYNLANPLAINVRSHEGSERNYTLYTINYGEFKTFELLGVKGKITRTEYDYSYYEINLEVPAGSDLSSVAPKFTLYSTNEVPYIDGVEQISEQTTVDFTKPVTYKFVCSHPQKPELKLESTCVVTVSVK